MTIIFKSVAVIIENNFLRISVVIIINILVMPFSNSLLLHGYNYAVFEDNL
jgi:hypothetical protein